MHLFGGGSCTPTFSDLFFFLFYFGLGPDPRRFMDRGHDPGIQGFSYRAKDAPFPSCTNFLQPVRCDQAEMQGSQPVPTSSPPKGATKLKYRVPGERKTTPQARLMSWVHVPTEQAREHCVRVPLPPHVHLAIELVEMHVGPNRCAARVGLSSWKGREGSRTKGRHTETVASPQTPRLQPPCRASRGARCLWGWRN